jgi:transcriptional regulator with AAA-type ATPase domain
MPHRPLFTRAERALLSLCAKLVSTNPFLEERVDLERRILGDAFVDTGRVISLSGAPGAPLENVRRIVLLVRPIVEPIRDRLAAGAGATDEERAIYRDVALYLLYDRFDERLQRLIDTRGVHVDFYDEFCGEHARFFDLPGSIPGVPETRLLLDFCYQARRAFHYIRSTILGRSRPIERLRGSVWEDIFAGNLPRYATWNYARMDRVSTLILGPTGTGKELVARAIAGARYLPFNPVTRCFPATADADFHALNISALAPSIIDSLLFGHERGSFTGAVKDTDGALAQCKAGGILYMDEVGDLAPDIQVKLLRVLQERVFLRLGEFEERSFLGRILAATQPDLIQQPSVRSDFYYRICSNTIETPSLRARLDDDPGELELLVRAFAAEEAGPGYVGALIDEVMRWIDKELRDHDWPGNVRELQVCVSNVLSHHVYTPRKGAPKPRPAPAPTPALEFTRGGPTMELVKQRAALDAYATTGNYQDAARLLQINYRTLRSLVAVAMRNAKRNA